MNSNNIDGASNLEPFENIKDQEDILSQIAAQGNAVDDSKNKVNGNTLDN